MAEITAQLVKTLREKTNVGMMECKAALTEANGDLEAAETILRKKGIAKAEKKADRQAKEGVIASYIHLGGRVGVLIEVNCETDFVAKNENFQSFVRDITLHIAAANPKFLSREEVPAELVAKEREIAAEQVKGKPANIVDKIVDGKLEKIYSDLCLLDQAYIKDDSKTISDVVKSKIAELGENIVIRRFVRYAVGEDI
jgi:elongation factor Ts